MFLKEKKFVLLFVWLSFNYILYLYTWLLTWCMQHDLILCKNSTTHYAPTLSRGSWSEQTWIYAIWGSFHKSFSLFLTKIKYLWISSTLTILYVNLEVYVKIPIIFIHFKSTETNVVFVHFFRISWSWVQERYCFWDA